MAKILFKFAAVLLAAALSAVMVSMMWIGGGVSFSDFLNAGRVYDVSKEELCAPSSTFYYLKKTGEFFLTGEKRSVKKIRLDRAERAWNYLYLDIESMSVPGLEAELRYFGKESGLIYQQPVTLVVGENVFKLNEETAIYRLGICIGEAGGERISIASMQVREKERPEIPEELPKVFGISFGVVFAVGSILCLCVRLSKPRPEEEMLSVYLCGGLCKGMKRLFRGFPAAEGRRSRRRVVFAFLFLSCIVWNVTGWSADAVLFRYCYLACALLLWMAGFFCLGEKPVRAVSFRLPVPCAWLMFWGWLMISDFWTTADVHYHEYVMVGAAGFFIFLWAQAEDAEQVFFNLTEGLKIVFFLSVIVCLFFRPNDPETPYTGIFGSTKTSAMFALLMLVTFLTGFDLAAEKMPKGRRRFLWDMPGIFLSLYLTVRSEEWMGYLLCAVVLLFYQIRLLAAIKKYAFFLKKRLFVILFSIAAAIAAVEGFHIGTQYIPQATGVILRYEGEEAPKEEESPKEEASKEEESPEEETIDAYYLRRLNLCGNAAGVRVFRKIAMTKSGYLFLAYRYGIFVLLPFVLYQLAVLMTGLAGFWKDRKRLWMLGVILIYIGFSVRGHAELPFAHPLWLCVYLCPAITFIKS